MSYSGAALYDDDTALDVRHRYRELVADGATGESATDTLLSEWAEMLDDPDDSPVFWVALADTQSKVGRLEPRVRDRALALIASGEDLARFAHDAQLHAQREKVLAKLVERLTGPQRNQARIRKPFRSISPVAFGDIFWFTMPSGRRVLLRCVGVTGDERDSYPTVELLDWNQEHTPPDPTTLPARVGRPNASGKWDDLLSLVRDRRDPDPASQVEIIARGTPVSRRRSFPSLMVRWADVERDLGRFFGM